MKTIYYLECDSEHGTDLTRDINELGYWGFYGKRKDAHKDMMTCVKEAKKQYSSQIKMEKKNGNIITIDLWKAEVRNDFDFETDTIWGVENRQLIEMRYICGRY